MTTELFYPLFTAILTGVLWIPVVIGYVLIGGPLKPSDYKVAPTSPLPAWVNRANLAQINAVENLATFAPVVLIAHAAGISISITVASAAVYFYTRAAHAVVHITGLQSIQNPYRVVHSRMDRVFDIRDRTATKSSVRSAQRRRRMRSTK